MIAIPNPSLSDLFSAGGKGDLGNPLDIKIIGWAYVLGGAIAAGFLMDDVIVTSGETGSYTFTWPSPPRGASAIFCIATPVVISANVVCQMVSPASDTTCGVLAKLAATGAPTTTQFFVVFFGTV